MKNIKMLESMRNHIRWCLMPGLDLFTRRRVGLSKYWMRGPRRVLDAGSGNGWFSYLAYKSGATVLAINIAEDQINKAVRFYNIWKKIPENRLKFEALNLYDINCLEPGFDEIICYETLEHIRDDARICRLFWKLLKKGGILHLCCPNAEHPRWCNDTLDAQEKGYHTRAGYTLESYRSLLEPIGFQITEIEGMGGALLTKISLLLEAVRRSVGDVWSLPLALSTLPFVWFDPRHMSCPYSLYVRAVKRGTFSP